MAFSSFEQVITGSIFFKLSTLKDTHLHAASVTAVAKLLAVANLLWWCCWLWLTLYAVTITLRLVSTWGSDKTETSIATPSGVHFNHQSGRQDGVWKHKHLPSAQCHWEAVSRNVSYASDTHLLWHITICPNWHIHHYVLTADVNKLHFIKYAGMISKFKQMFII